MLADLAMPLRRGDDSNNDGNDCKYNNTSSSGAMLSSSISNKREYFEAIKSYYTLVMKHLSSSSSPSLPRPAPSDVSDGIETDVPAVLYVAVNNCVYDVSTFFKEHPGGEAVLIEFAGRDATREFELGCHSHFARDLMALYLIWSPCEYTGHHKSIELPLCCHKV